MLEGAECFTVVGDIENAAKKVDTSHLSHNNLTDAPCTISSKHLTSNLTSNHISYEPEVHQSQVFNNMDTLSETFSAGEGPMVNVVQTAAIETPAESNSLTASKKVHGILDQHLFKVAGPHQLDKRRQKQQETVEKMFPHIAATHKQIGNALAGVGVGTMQQKLMKAIKFYISGCSKEYEEVNSSTQKCRRLARSMSRTMDLLHEICSTFEDSAEYIHRMSELVAIYVSCELRSANEFKENKPLISNRICNNIYKHLKARNEQDTKANILRMFVYMPKMHSEREVMTEIYKFFIPKEQIILQRELPDKLFIQYLIVFYHWKKLEFDAEEQMRVIEFANKFMRPAKTLCANHIYAKHLPKYGSRRKATKFILQNLKYFQDLRNASIYDNQIHSGMGVIDLSDEDNPLENSVSYADFASIVKNVEITPRAPPIKHEQQIVTATIDLTLDDDNETETDWLETLKMNAIKLQPSLHTLTLLACRTAAISDSSKDKPTEIIELDSDSDLDLEEPEQISSNYLDFESEEIGTIDCLNDEDDDLLNTNLRDNDSNGPLIISKPAATEKSSSTCLAAEKSLTSNKTTHTSIPNLKINSSVDTNHADFSDLQNTQINPKIPQACNSTNTSSLQQQKVTQFTMPRISDSYSWRRKSIHISSSPNNTTDITSADRNSNSDEIETDGEHISTNIGIKTIQSNSSKVIFSQTVASRLQDVDFDEEEAAFNTQPESSLKADKPNQKKQVKFNDNLIVPSRANSVQHPIKPAIKTVKHNNLQSTPIFSTAPLQRFSPIFSTAPLQRFSCSSPASSTSPYSETIKQIAEKEHIDALSTVFSRYGLVNNNHASKKTWKKNTKKTSQSYSKSVMKNIQHSQQQSQKSSPTCQLRDFSPDFRTKGALKAYPVNVCNSFHTIQPQFETGDKLKKKCCVVIERNDVLEEHEREKAAYINNLLQIQREKRRQALEKRQRQDEERERLLREKAMEAKRIKDEIEELRRQQKEKNRYRAEEQMIREREKELRDRLLKERHRRYQLLKRTSHLKRKEIELVRLRKELSVADAEVISSVSTTVLSAQTTKTASRQRSETIDERWLTSTTKDITDSIMKQSANSNDNDEVLNNSVTELSVQKEVRPSTPEKCTTNAKLSTDEVEQKTTALPSMQFPEVSEEKMSVLPKSAIKHVKVRLKRMFIDKYFSEKASDEVQKQSVHQDTVKMDTKMRERMLKAKNELKAQLEKIEHMQKESSEINHPIPDEIKNITNNSLSHLIHENKCQQAPIKIFEEENVSETPNAAAEVASSSLALLANTAATAPIAEMNTNNNAVKLPSEPLDLPKIPLIVEVTISKTPHIVIAEDKENYLQLTPKLPTLYRISENDNIVEKNEGDIRKEASLRLINMDATPTVPTYLFNGESRDVPTPTPPPLSMLSVASTIPVTFESAVATPSEQTEVSITTTANANNLALSTTSDHEVSSTQETLCESLKRNASHLTQTPTNTVISTQATTTIAVAASDAFTDAASVQNNEIDTTDRLPENSTTLRRRTRKFSTFDESLRNGNFEHMKRRKTICAESTYGLQSSAVEINFSGNATSPSTTTNPLEKLPSRRRGGRTAKLSAGTTAIKKLQRSVSTSTPPNATEDTVGRTLHCNSPGVLTLVDTDIKHTYSKNNSVQNVFVPPEIEVCLEQETHDVNLKSSSVSAKALKNKKKSKSSVGSAIKEKGNTMLKTFKGAKMKLIETRNADIKPVKLKAIKVHTLSKLSIPASGRRKR